MFPKGSTHELPGEPARSQLCTPGPELGLYPRCHSHWAEAKLGWWLESEGSVPGTSSVGLGQAGKGVGATTAEAQLLSGKYWI